jgi:hypothetical protein
LKDGEKIGYRRTDRRTDGQTDRVNEFNRAIFFQKYALIITPATTQRLSNNLNSTQVGPNSGVIKNQAGSHRDHWTVHHHVQKPGRELDSGKFWKGIPAHISPIPSSLPIHQQATLHLRAQVTLQCATPIQIPTCSRFLHEPIDHFVGIYINMSKNPHQPNHKLILSQPPQSFLTLVDDKMSLWWNFPRTQRLNRIQTVSQNQTRSHEVQGGEQRNNFRSERTRWFLEAISKTLLTQIKNQYFLNKNNAPLAVWREETNDSLLQVYQIWKLLIIFLGSSIFSDPKWKKKVFIVVKFSIEIPFQRAQALGSTAKIEWAVIESISRKSK